MAPRTDNEIADLVQGRQAERLLTLVGVPALFLLLGGVGSAVWGEIRQNAAQETTVAVIAQRVGVMEGRLDRELADARSHTRDTAARLEESRGASDRQRAERDGAQDQRIAELAASLTASREGFVRLTAQVEGARSDLAEIKAILTRRDRADTSADPAPYAGATRGARGGGLAN